MEREERRMEKRYMHRVIAVLSLFYPFPRREGGKKRKGGGGIEVTHFHNLLFSLSPSN